MTSSLTRAIFDAHRDAGGTERDREPTLTLRPDHVLLGGEAGAIAVRMFRQHIGGSVRVPRASFAAEACSTWSHDPAFRWDEALVADATAAGIEVVRPGEGHGVPHYLERHAAPGKLAVSSGWRATRAGAMGMLAWPASSVEAAALLAGAAVACTPPPIVTVRFVGSLVRGIGGHDVAVELARRLPPAGVRDGVIECRGSGVEHLDMQARMELADGVVWCGARAAIVPSDEVTRAWLRVQGREADWKHFALDGLEDVSFELDLDRIEPSLVEFESRPAPCWVRQMAGNPVGRVVVGPQASLDEWRVLAEMLRDRRVASGTSCVLVPGSRRIVEAARALGVWDALHAAHVQVAPHGEGPPASRRLRGVSLRCGDEPSSLPGQWWASIETCAAAALSGVVVDPREVESGAAFPDRDRIAADTPRTPAGEVSPPPARSAAARPWSRRGMVLLAVGDDVSSSMVLPWGPRAAALCLAELGRHCFAALDRDFARRATSAGGGWLVGGRGFLDGPRADLAAWVLADLGIRGVIARGYAPRAERELTDAGILPLWVRPAADPVLEPGDELELPEGLDALERGVPVPVRNLTRGIEELFLHRLSDHELDVLRTGGLLATAGPR